MTSRVRPGTRIAGRYRIERKLAQGGMSAVFEAVDEKFEQAVALKLAFPENNHEEFKARFRREALIGRLLGQHSTGFVRALDWGELEDSALYLVMDLVKEARELDLLSGGRPERLERLARAAQLVTDVHAVGIIHRDLKPANFLTNTEGTIFLGDFGLAKLLGQDETEAEAAQDHRLGHLTSTGLALGTPYYMAPEQASAKHVDQRADIYPLGVMLFLALTSELPYQGSLPELLAAQQRVLAGLSPAPNAKERDSTVPPELDALCRRAMALDPDKRLPSAAMFHESLLPHVARVPGQRRGGAKGGTMRLTKRIDDPRLLRPTPALEPGGEGLPAKRGQVLRGPPIDAEETIAPGMAAPRQAHRAPAGDADETIAPAPRGRAPAHDPSSEETIAPGAPAPRGQPRQAPPPPPSQLKPVEGEELVFENTRDGSILTWVAAGAFKTGGEGDKRDPGLVRVDGYYMGRYPITWAQYLHFCHETGREPPSPSFPVEDDHPVHNVAWDDAQAYCAWAGVRLPTASEWELAARGQDGRIYPWGDAPPDVDTCNWAQHPAYGKRTTTPVGLFPAGASASGCFDMAGNVLEWVEDPDADAANAPTRELRGGAWTMDAQFCRVDRGVFLPADAREPHVGFRVARSATADHGLADRTMGKPTQLPTSLSSAMASKFGGRRAAPAAEPAQPPPRTTQRQAPAKAPPASPPPLALDRSASGYFDARGNMPNPAQGHAVAAIAALVPAFGKGVHVRGREVKFVHEEAQVGLSVLVIDQLARYCFLEQRVTFDPIRTVGKPTGMANLMLAMNAVNHYANLRCVVTEDRLRFRRELLLEPGSEKPIEGEVLHHGADNLIREWSRVFPSVREVQEGAPWHEALRQLLQTPYPASETAASTVETRLVGSITTQRLGGGRLQVANDEPPPGQSEITLTCGEDEVLAEFLVRQWAPPIDQVMAVKNGEPAPLIHALLMELNDKNRDRAYALCWDPKRGVVGRSLLTGAGILPHAEQLGQFIELLESARRNESVESLP